MHSIGNTPLTAACSVGSLEIVKYLCEKQHVNPFTGRNGTYDLLSEAHDHPQVLEYLNSLRNDS